MTAVMMIGGGSKAKRSKKKTSAAVDAVLQDNAIGSPPASPAPALTPGTSRHIPFLEDVSGKCIWNVVCVFLFPNLIMSLFVVEHLLT